MCQGTLDTACPFSLKMAGFQTGSQDGHFRYRTEQFRLLCKKNGEPNGSPFG